MTKIPRGHRRAPFLPIPAEGAFDRAALDRKFLALPSTEAQWITQIPVDYCYYYDHHG